MQEKTKQWLNDFFILNAGTLLTAVGSYFFKFPNNFATGGVSGIAVGLGLGRAAGRDRGCLDV